MSKKSEHFCDITEEELIKRRGLVEQLRNRRRHSGINREECRSILDSVEWDLDRALEITDNKKKLNN